MSYPVPVTGLVLFFHKYKTYIVTAHCYLAEVALLMDQDTSFYRKLTLLVSELRNKFSLPVNYR